MNDKPLNKAQEIARKKAVALQYKADYVAPKVVARGTGHMAQKIMDTAVDADVALYENPALVEQLTKVDLGDEIPPELYEVVAKILVFVDDLDKLEGLRRNG
ncbi:MAG: EscU/YscU/HrcU family type III secretion system export apparatus switch protein [Defluviitaleaceae bacterium]|nr:EscU/YscU/HrcU family type III secretion system export apparatus switch protein [Defluviitaleaceae bacterium]